MSKKNELPEERPEFIELAKKTINGYKELMSLLGEQMGDINTDLKLPVSKPTSELLEYDLSMAQDDPTKGLGRLISVDFRDTKYLMTKNLPKRTSGVTYRYWRTGKVLDQADTSQCVAFSGQQYLVTGPITNPFYKTPVELYNECQKVDEWEGENYDGTSVRALFKVLQNAGYIKEYTWAYDTQTVVRHLLDTGPVVLGTNWYNSMFYPDAITGFITLRANSGLAGGHAYMVKGCNNDKLCPDGSRGAIRIINSWGTEWGDNGHAWISYKDADRLIKNWGEAATGTELKFVEEAKG